MKKQYPIPGTLNLLIGSFFVALLSFQYFLFPLWLRTEPGLWPLIFPFALLTAPFWSLAHDALHGVFHPNRAVNRIFSWVFGTLFGSSYRLLRFGHNMHHRFNRTSVDTSEVADRGVFSAVLYYGKLFSGLYWMELFVPLALFLPRPLILRLSRAFFPVKSLQNSIASFLASDLQAIRMDTLFVYGVLGVSAWLYGEQWPVLLGVLFLRGFIISYLDNIYHYGSRMEADRLGNTSSSYNLSLPRVLSALYLHFNFHRVHHQAPMVPWYYLPDAFAEQGDRFDYPYLSAALRQLRGPLPAVVLEGQA